MAEYLADASLPPVMRRFLRYTLINTTSKAENIGKVVPTSEGQVALARQIEEELREIGVADTHFDEATGILYAKVPAHGVDGGVVKKIGFCPHLDTAPDYNTDTRAELVEYSGEGDLVVGGGKAVLKAAELEGYGGDTIAVTDGTSLLGGDDKAAIAAVVCAVAEILEADKNQGGAAAPHGEIHLAFLPDEEIGLLGAKALTTNDRFHPDFGYCLDCCKVGEYIVRTWNSAMADITIKGTPAHPMSAKGNLVNPITIFHDFIVAHLPPAERPELTEHEEGYMYVRAVSGDAQEMKAKLIVSYFKDEELAERKALLQKLVDGINAMYPGIAAVTIADRYCNPEGLLGKNAYVTEMMLDAMASLGIAPIPKSMRGGYDGCALAQQGLPFANFFTGAHNFHSNTEFLPQRSLVAAKEMVRELVYATARRK